MNKIKKAIAMLLVFSLFTILPTFAQEYEEIEITQTQDFKKLEAFGIVTSEDELFYYTNVSRGIFVYYAMKICGSAHLYEETPAVFTDVSDDTIGAKEIMTACSLGIISGKPDGRFYPDDDITMSEAAKILISILGYDEIAEKKGGFTSGYIALSNRFELFKGCKFSTQSSVSVRDFLRILINTLETEIPKIETVAQKEDILSASYSVIEGETLLEEVFDIHKAEGILEANEYTSINGLSELAENVVTINEKNYYAGSTEASELLGYNTEFYYKADDTKLYNEILFITPYHTDVTEVGSEDIVKEKVTTTNFSYYENGSKRKVSNAKIEKSATMIYNGGQKKISAGDLCPENGTVTLIDNNNDNVFDVISIMNYRTILVSGVSLSTYTVSDLLGGENITLDPEDKKYNVIIYKDGEKADFSSISLRDVISYAQSTSNKRNVKYLNVSSEKITGTVDAIAEDYINIDEESFSVQGDISGKFSLGEYGVFYLDFMGKVVAKKLSNDIVYGYLNNLDTENFDKVFARIFTENNRWVVLEFNEKITFNKKKLSAEDVYDKFMEMDNFRQLIRYTVDDEGKINMIALADEFVEYSAEEENAIEQDVFRTYPEISSARYRTSIKSFGNTVRIDDGTKIFMIPDQSTEDADEDAFSVINRNTLVSDATYENITPYDLDRARLAKAVVLIGNGKIISEKSAFLVVDKIIKTINSDGIWTDSIKGYYKNSPITLSAKDDTIYDELSEPLSNGDVIQILLDDNGNITKLNLRYNFSEGINQKFVVNSLYSSSTFIAGTVYYSVGEQQTIIVDGPDGKVVLVADDETEVSIYDTKDKTLTAGTIADLEKGNSFVARISYYSINEIIVYR